MATAVPSGDATFSPAMADAVNYIDWVLSRFDDVLHGAILEVGLGHGSYQPFLAARGTYCGIDIDEAVVADAARRFPTGTFLAADILAPDLADRLAGRRFDAILCFNVLEHIADDATAVCNLVNLLVPGGHLLLGVPALPALYNDLDRLAGHHRRYRRRELAALLPADTARLIRLDFFNPLGALGWWLNRFIKHETLAAPVVGRQVALFDRWVLPLSKALDPLTRGVFGQSLLCVARKL